MQIPAAVKHVLSVCAAFAVVAGCNSGGLQLAPTGRGQQNAATAAYKTVQPGSIVYTPVDEQIGKSGKLELNLDNHGTNDFAFRDNYHPAYQHVGMGPPRLCGAVGGLGISPNHRRDGIENGATVGWAAALAYGSQIDSNVTFDRAGSLMFGYGVGCVRERGSQGYWNGATNMYLGLELKIHGQIHYGWAEVSSFGGEYGVFATLTGYAYETVPGVAIAAGQTQ